MMSITRLPPTLARRHHNRQLFADRHLDVTLPQRGAWIALRDEAAPVLARVRAFLAAFKPSTNEARTDREPGRPGSRPSATASRSRTPAGTKKSDKLFYRDRAALSANQNRALTDAALAVGDARPRGWRLTVTLAGDDDAISRVSARRIACSMLHGVRDFIEEVQKRRPRAAGKLTPAGLALRGGQAEQAPPRMPVGRG